MVADYAKTIDLYPLMLDFSPVKGPEGNIEYLLYLSKNADDLNLFEKNEHIDIDDVVEKSHAELDT